VIYLIKLLIETSRRLNRWQYHYKKLFHLLIEKEMTNADLQKQAGFSANIITRLKRNGYVSLETIESICRTLNCGVDDILEFVPDEDKK
jgi:putative transcriptional regulator